MLDWNQISDEGAKELAEALKVNNSLKILKLSIFIKNYITRKKFSGDRRYKSFS